jgi:hypothetical protein
MRRLIACALVLLGLTACSGRDSTVGPSSVQGKGIALSGNLAFGDVQVGTTATATLTISNAGTTAVTVSGISYPPGFTGAWSGTVPAAASQQIPVTFAPSAVTTYGGTVIVSSDATGGTNTLSASGTGRALQAKAIGLSGTLAFGDVAVGSAATATLTISNAGNAPLNVARINYPSGFSGAWSGLLPVGGSQPVLVTFAPTAEASYGGTVAVVSDATAGVSTVTASGAGTAAASKVIGLSGVLAFGNVGVGLTSTATLTISNSGNAPLTVNGVNYPAGFSGAWSGTIAAGGSHAVTITFMPTTATAYGGSVTVTSDATAGANTIAISGTGMSAVATKVIGLSGNLGFGNVVVGAPPSTATLTISNTGDTALTVTGINYPAGFSGAWSGTIAAGGSHAVTITFMPTTATAYGGSVTVTSDATAGANSIAISGVGTSPAAVDLSGTWSGTYSIAGVSGGECVGDAYRSDLIGPLLAFTMNVTQEGTTLDATAKDPASTLSISYTGTASPAPPFPLRSTEAQPTAVPYTCSPGVARLVRFASGIMNWTLTGERTAIGTATENYDVLDSATMTSVGTMIITAQFTVAR